MAAMATTKNDLPDSDGDGGQPSNKATTKSNSATTESNKAPTRASASTPDDDLRKRYLEALERKRAGGSAAATGHGADTATAPTSNDKVKRTFRRRAGG